MDSTEQPNLDDASTLWGIVEQQLDAFCQRWEQAPPTPEIKPFVANLDPAARRFVLMDLIKLDLEYRWGSDSVMPIDWYFETWPELVIDEVVPAELLYEDIYQRRKHGDQVSIDDYVSRYPRPRNLYAG